MDYQDLLEPEIKAEDQYQLTIYDAIGMCLMMLLNPIVSRIRKDKEGEWYQIKKCSERDWVLLTFYLGVLIVFSVYQIFNIIRRNENKRTKMNDVSLNSSIYCYRFAAGVVGVSFVGGFLAAGSSTLLSIFMIALGIYPFVASSTSLLLAVIFSGSSALIYAVQGQVYLTATLVCGSLVLTSTVITRMTLYQTFMKHGRASIILLFISISLLLSIPSNLYQVLPHIKEDHDQGKNIWAFQSLCP